MLKLWKGCLIIMNETSKSLAGALDFLLDQVYNLAMHREVKGVNDTIDNCLEQVMGLLNYALNKAQELNL